MRGRAKVGLFVAFAVFAAAIANVRAADRRRHKLAHTPALNKPIAAASRASAATP